MAEYPSFTAEDLARFSMRPAASYKDANALTSISQATLLFKIGTCLAALPDDPVERELAHTAILAYADYIYLALDYAKAAASPFNSESLGSYSYSKSAAAVASGNKTGIMWFDLAIEKLGRCGQGGESTPDHGGIEMFEHDATFVRGSSGDNIRMLSPQDARLSAQYGYAPSGMA